jgi:hypothetical protein
MRGAAARLLPRAPALISMKRDLSAFVFYDHDTDFDTETDFIATIPSGIHNKEKL